jgi:hypothetical protein
VSRDVIQRGRNDKRKQPECPRRLSALPDDACVAGRHFGLVHPPPHPLQLQLPSKARSPFDPFQLCAARGRSYPFMTIMNCSECQGSAFARFIGVLPPGRQLFLPEKFTESLQSAYCSRMKNQLCILYVPHIHCLIYVSVLAGLPNNTMY